MSRQHGRGSNDTAERERAVDKEGVLRHILAVCNMSRGGRGRPQQFSQTLQSDSNHSRVTKVIPESQIRR